MKILSAEQIREADAFTIENEPIRSLDLMERAANAFVKWFVEQFNATRDVNIICGPGNNGGDGLAIGRLLFGRGYKVNVHVIKVSDKCSEDFRLNLNRLKELIPIHEILNNNHIPAFESNLVIIDAIFGSGLTRPAEGLYGKVIKAMNKSSATIVSVDIASGLFTDSHSEGENIVQPDYTITFQLPKLAFLLPSNEKYTGKVVVVDIGLSKDFIHTVASQTFYVDKEFVSSKVKRRNFFSHKGTYGKILLIAGSKGKMGACVLATKACLRTGSGLVTAHIPKAGYEIMQISVPEAMTSLDKSKKIFTSLPDISIYDTLGIGPGLGTDEKTVAAFSQLLIQADKPVVIDADGLNILSKHKDIIDKLPPHSILTPHPKEFERLAGEPENDFERLEMQKEFSARYNVIMVYKGGYTSISTPDGKLFFNASGNPGLATGGTGDVLTGVITSLLGQGYHPEDATVLGVYLHGLSGDIAIRRKGPEALIASDVIEHIADAYKELTGFNNFDKPVSFY